MLFGLPTAFAIEAISEPTLKIPSAVWGRMQIWCQGVALGDFSSEHCGLYDAYDGFKSLETTLLKLWRQDFEGISELEILNLLDERLYGYHGDVEIEDSRTVDECRRDWTEYGHFNFLTNWGEQFDQSGKSFILCRPEGRVQILNRSLPAQCGIVIEAPLLTAKAAMRDFIKWFESETQRLSGKSIT
ncbi:MAG: hypothetical protein V4488_16770 [Pseudomonadota bacterium]